MPIIVMRGEGGGEIRVEVADDPLEAPGGNFRGGDKGDICERAGRYVENFGQVGEQIMSVCREIYIKYQAAAGAARPAELEIKFGVKLSGETGIPFVSKGAAEATIEVTAKWKGAAPVGGLES